MKLKGRHMTQARHFFLVPVTSDETEELYLITTPPLGFYKFDEGTAALPRSAPCLFYGAILSAPG